MSKSSQRCIRLADDSCCPIPAEPTQRPARYRYLIEELNELDGNRWTPITFLSAVVTLCDLCLFGSLIPGMPTSHPRLVNWDDLHPAWRYVKLYRWFEADSTRRNSLFSAIERGESKTALDKPCDSLGWARWSGLISTLASKRYRRLRGISPHLFKQFEGAIKFREGHDNCFLSSVLSAYRGLADAVTSYDPTQGERLAKLANRFIRAAMIPQRFAPPVMVNRGKVKFNSALDSESIGFCMAYYYLAHFAEKMVFDDNLNYPLQLSSDDWIAKLFTDFFGLSPEHVFKFGG